MIQAAFFGPQTQLERVYPPSRRAHLEKVAAFFPHRIDAGNFSTYAAELREIEVIFSTWGMPSLSDSQIAQMPKLRAVFYAAGTVQHFARPFLARGIEVFSAWSANGVPVAQWTLAQILLANKGFFRNHREFQSERMGQKSFSGRGNFGATVSLLGAGQIGRRVIEYLRPFDLEICVFDPFLSEEAARELNVEKVELNAAFERGDVVSNHLANLPATVGMLRGKHFAVMPPNATFINTGRGATVRESELIEVLAARSDLNALLDVTDPEPPLPDSPLWEMKNVVLTSHIAGSIGDEVVRMADYMIEEFESWLDGKPTRFSVSEAMLETMA
jgi:phosphoglycerate dehydrogenase-like enzyme